MKKKKEMIVIRIPKKYKTKLTELAEEKGLYWAGRPNISAALRLIIEEWFDVTAATNAVREYKTGETLNWNKVYEELK